jgi:hypothetical protein
VVALPYEAIWELQDLWLCVCMAPLWLRGIRGNKSIPRVGWEVPVKFQRLASMRSEGMRVSKDRLDDHLHHRLWYFT